MELEKYFYYSKLHCLESKLSSLELKLQMAIFTAPIDIFLTIIY